MSGTTETIRRMNWGCGNSAQPGWINSDRRIVTGVDLPCDIADGLPLTDASLDYIVSVHALQEIPFPQLVPTLSELCRVLKPDGALRLILPDFTLGLDAYLNGRKEHFLVPDEDAASLGGKFIVHMLWYSHSRVLFTFDFIEELLQRAGFRDVRRCQPRQSSLGLAGITDLDNREDESLFVEARK